jgi:hypothetical protein
MDNLIKKFAEAGLTLKMSKDPIGTTNEDVFGLDIKRAFKGNARSEFFSMWPGHESSIIQVQDINKDIGQLVLTVKEQKREFTEAVTAYWILKDVQKKGTEEWLKERPDCFIKGGTIYAKRTTPEGKRHILLGLDERQLFMAQLPRACTTVRQAHESLKAPILTTADGKQRGKTIRQGEWFFLNCTPEEEKTIREGLRRNTLFMKKSIGIGEATGTRQGKPHVADEVVTMPAPKLEHGFSTRGRPDVFIRGKVKHPDHATVSFSSWRKVIRNNEPVSSNGNIGGGTWID